jgi:hypothetical protein
MGPFVESALDLRAGIEVLLPESRGDALDKVAYCGRDGWSAADVTRPGESLHFYI